MDTKKQATGVSKNLVTGKKRKKKKIMKKDITVDNPKTSSRKVVSVPLASAITISKMETQCSSSSSIESHRPVMKSARFEDNPQSDGMRKEESGTRSDSLMDSSSTESCNNTDHSNSHSSTVEGEVLISTASMLKPKHHSKEETVVDTSVYKLKSLASLRWIDELSDEEKEEERIEVYKQDRRERYKKDMLMRRDQSRENQLHQTCITTVLLYNKS